LSQSISANPRSPTIAEKRLTVSISYRGCDGRRM
jgi:hypothetical protein